MARMIPLTPPLSEPVGETLEFRALSFNADGGLMAHVVCFNGTATAKHDDTINLGKDADRRTFAKKSISGTDVPEEAAAYALMTLSHAIEAMRQKVARSDPSADAYVPEYSTTENGHIYLKPGQKAQQITNFVGKIVEAIEQHDGSGEVRTLLHIEATRAGRSREFTVPIEVLSNSQWAMKYVDAGATIYPGGHPHIQAALQANSGEIPIRRIYTYTGWTKTDDGFRYLHSDGSIPADPNIHVGLTGALQHYTLPSPPEADRLRDAILDSLSLWDLCLDRASVPAQIAPYAAALGNTDFSFHFVGKTGSFKTQIGCLSLQHFGSAMDDSNVPAGWGSTENALLYLAFYTKDAILLIDDYVQVGNSYQQRQQDKKVDGVLRGQANRQGRARLNDQITLRESKPPRGLIISTGEDTPQIGSMVARILTIDIDRGMIDSGKLRRYQRTAKSGTYAESLSGFISWLAPQYEIVSRNWQEEKDDLRDELSFRAHHPRTRDMIAQLVFALRLFIRYATESGAVSEVEAKHYFQRGLLALCEAGARHSRQTEDYEPTTRFIDIVMSAIASGKAHVAGPEGDYPGGFRQWGWEASQSEEGPRYRSRGECSGYIVEEDLFLHYHNAYSCVKKYARDSGEEFNTSREQLGKQLSEKNLLVSVDRTRQTNYIRKRINGGDHKVFHFSTADFLSPQPAKPDNGAESLSGLAVESEKESAPSPIPEEVF